MPIAQKVGYGLGSIDDMWGHWLYPGLAYQVFNIFLGVSPALVGRALFLNRFIDAVSDPLFGWMSDNTRTRLGRRRPFILVGSILSGLGLPFLFFVRPGWNEMTYFWFIVLSSALYIPAMSCFYMAYQSLGVELTPDYHERTSVFSYRNAIQKLPEVGLFFAAQFTTLTVWINARNSNVFEKIGQLATSLSAWTVAVKGEPNILLGAQVYCVLLGALMVAAGVAVFALVRERYYDRLAHAQAKVSIADTLYKVMRCGPFRRQLYIVLAYNTGMSMVGTLGYYDTVYYVCKGDVASGAHWNFYMGIAGMVFGLAGIRAYAAVARRFGKIAAMTCVQYAAIAVFVSTWWLYDPRMPWLQPLASGLIAFNHAGFWTLDGSIAADVMDYDELESGQRREGAFSACKSWVMKVGMAVGTLVSGEVLARIGFEAKLGGAQPAHALIMLRVLLATIPICGFGLALTALHRFPLTPSAMATIRQKLEERRGTV